MIRTKRMERALDRALAPVVAAVEEVGAKVDDRTHHDEILAANVARVDARIEAVHEQAAARLAGVQRELAEARGESGAALETAAEWRRKAERLEYERDAARFNANSAHTAEAAWKESWRGRTRKACRSQQRQLRRVPRT